MTDSAESLAAALARYEIELPEDQAEQIDQYCQALWAWNEKLNLTRHTDYDRFVARDLFDSLQLAELLEPDEVVLDVGTGGGVPGVVLSIVRPDVHVTLCESVGKKAMALGDMAEKLDLQVNIFHARAEDLLEEHAFDTLTARAVAPLRKMLTWLAPCWERFGRLLAIKGTKWVEERNEARHYGLLKPLNLRKAAEYFTPGTDAESVILQIWPKESGE